LNITKALEIEVAEERKTYGETWLYLEAGRYTLTQLRQAVAELEKFHQLLAQSMEKTDEPTSR
jgi:hypothetical protein